MSAAHRVFDVPELLELILCQVLVQIRELKLVERQWRDMIKTSKKIRRSRIVQGFRSLEPYTPKTVTPAEVQKMLPEDLTRLVMQKMCYQSHICMYGASDWLRLNPIFEDVHVLDHRERKEGRTDIVREISITMKEASDFSAEQLEEFVTEPPCSVITVFPCDLDDKEQVYYLPPLYQQNNCWAYNKDGLKVKDLIKARDGMCEAQRSCGAGYGTEIGGVVATFAVYTNEHSKAGRITGAPSAAPPKNSGSGGEREGDWLNYFEGPVPRYREIWHTGEVLRKMTEKDLPLQRIWKNDLDARAPGELLPGELFPDED